MRLYFLILRLAAAFGHRKARLLVQGQDKTLAAIRKDKRLHADNHPLIWFHAASVGEFEQARPIIERLRQEKYPCKILLTFFSPSGYEMRKNYDKADAVYYLPFATTKNAAAFLEAVKPTMAVFSKYEFWPAYLKQLRKREITTYSISAIFRPNQLFFMPWGRPYLNLLKCFTHIFVQDEDSLHLLNQHGISHCSVAGDTRFDRVSAVAAQAKQIPLVAQFCETEHSLLDTHAHSQDVIVAGSTWPEDEVLFAKYVEEHPDVRLVLVPHEIDAAHMHKIFLTFKGRFVRFSEATKENIHQCRILVVDTMGMLSSLYRYATVGYIGGGFGAGIHNTIEAAVYGIPVLFGPKYHKFREAKGLIAVGASQSVKTYAEFAEAMDNARLRHEQMGNAARQYVASELGATDKIYNELFTQTTE